jgi:PKD repeat protein
VSFTSTSTGSITAYAWTFGDGGTSTAQNPTHTYQNAGTYTVSLKVTGPSGSNTATKTNFITVNPATSTPSGLVAAYHFNEGSGTTVHDVSGKGNHGTIAGATWTTAGKFGKALSFDGVNDWVTVKDASSLDLSTGMTLEAWVYPTATPTNWSTVIMKEQPGEFVYTLYAGSPANRPSVIFNVSTTLSGERMVTGPSALPLNTWSHLAGTYDGATLSLYVNGVVVSSQAFSGRIQTSSSPLRIGGNSVWNEYFKGRIDEVRIYNRALSAAEIKTDMNAPIGGAGVAGAALGRPAAVLMRLQEAVFGKGSAARGTTAQNMTQTAFDGGAAPGGRERQFASGTTPSRSGADTATATALPLTAEHVTIGEAQVDHRWQRIEFGKSFADPIVVAKPLSYREATPAVVGIRHVDPAGFEMRLLSWDSSQDTRTAETVGYLVVERGRYQLGDETHMEANSIAVQPAKPRGSAAFTQQFAAVPVVLTAISDLREADAVARPVGASKTRLLFRLQQPSDSPPKLLPPTLSYIAWEPSAGTVDGLTFEVGRTQQIRRDEFSTLRFAERFAEAPVFLADIQTTGGGSPLNVRWETKDTDSVAVKIDEESRPTEHAAQRPDVVGYILIR